MEASELRISNYVQRKSNGSICTVNWGIIKDIELGIGSDYEPIQITEDWLVKFKYNFDKFDIIEKSYRGKYIFILIQDLIFYFFTDNNTLVRANGIKYELIHQLQNLYFALTEKELILIE